MGVDLRLGYEISFLMVLPWHFIFIFIHHIVVAANKHNKQHDRVTQDHKQTRPITPDITPDIYKTGCQCFFSNCSRIC